MPDFFKNAHFVKSGLRVSDLREDQISKILELGKTVRAFTATSAKVIVNSLKYDLDVTRVFGKYQQVVSSGGKSHHAPNLIFIYGVDVATEMIHATKSKLVAAKRKNLSVAEHFISNNSAFTDAGIFWESLSDAQKSRVRRLLEGIHISRLNDRKSTVVDFIKYDMKSYLGRIKRLMHTKSGTLRYYILRFPKDVALTKYRQANSNKRKGFPSTVEYWINKGAKLDDIPELVKEHNTLAARSIAARTIGTDLRSCRSRNFWMRKGYSEDEAVARVRKIQDSWFGKSTEYRDDRILRRQRTLDEKSPEEIAFINLKKSHSPEGIMARTGCDKQTAVVVSENIFKKRNRVSKSSQELFLGVSSILGCEGLYFHSLNHEKVINGKYVDFYDEFSNTVIEFNGVYWHARDLPDEYMVYGRSAKQIREDDIDRTNTILLSSLVDRVHVIWEDEFRKNKEEVIQSTINFLTTNRKCYGK